MPKTKLFYGWVVLAAMLVFGTTIWGVYYSYGVFFKSLQSEFNLSRAATSSVFSAQMVLGCGFAILMGWVLDRYGPKIVVFAMGLFTGLGLVLTSQTNSLWQLFITYSLLLSIGTSAIYVVVVAIVSRWFDKKRGLAVGIGITGGGLGPVIMAPLASVLISNFDWRMAYLVIGGIAWVAVIPLSRLLKKDPYEIGVLPDGAKSGSRDIKQEASVHPAHLSVSQASRTRSFWLFIVARLIIAASYLLITNHIVAHATDRGISIGQAVTIISMIGGASIAGRVLTGVVSDKIGSKLASTICTLLQGGAMLLLLRPEDLRTFYLFASIFGFGYGGLMAAMGALTGDIFGIGNIGAIMGVLGIGWSAGAALGPFLGGLIFDINNSYFLAFLMGAVAMFIAALLIALTRREIVVIPERGKPLLASSKG